MARMTDLGHWSGYTINKYPQLATIPLQALNRHTYTDSGNIIRSPPLTQESSIGTISLGQSNNVDRNCIVIKSCYCDNL